MSLYTMDKINKANLSFKDGRKLKLLPVHGSIEGGMLFDLPTIKSFGPIWSYNKENVVVPVLLSPYMNLDGSVWHAWAIYPTGIKFSITTHHIDAELYKDNYITWQTKFKMEQNGSVKHYGTPTVMGCKEL